MTVLVQVLDQIVGLMGELSARYAIVGGMAMILRVQTRPTEDVDVVVVLPVARAREVVDRAVARGLAFDPSEFTAFGSAGLVRLWLPPERSAGADLIFADVPFLEEVVRRATPVRTPVGELPVATAEDLLLMKLDANRPDDLEDAIAIKDVCFSSLDRVYLAKQGRDLGLSARLEALLGPLP